MKMSVLATVIVITMMVLLVDDDDFCSSNLHGSLAPALWFTTTCSTKRVFATCWTIDDDDDDDAGADGDDRGCGGDNSDIFLYRKSTQFHTCIKRMFS